MVTACPSCKATAFEDTVDGGWCSNCGATRAEMVAQRLIEPPSGILCPQCAYGGGGIVGVPRGGRCPTCGWQHQGPPVDPGVGSWVPRDLAALDGAADEAPTLLVREDGFALMYRGRVHWIIGETESAKTWIAFVAFAQVLAAGGKVLFLDYEDDESTFLERMRALGVADEVLYDVGRVAYVRPEESITDGKGRFTAGNADFAKLVEWGADLVVLDGVTEAMNLEGLDPLSNSDVSTWMRLVPRPLARAGACTVALDHVVKSKEDRGRYAIGGVHKLNGLDGAAYIATPVQHFGRSSSQPIEGLTRLTVAKDRRGYIRGRIGEDKVAAVVSLTSYPDGGVTAHVRRAEDAGTDRYEAVVAEHLLTYDGATKTSLRELGNSDSVDEAVKAMVSRGHVEVVQKGNSHRHHLTDEGRERWAVK